MNQVQNLDVVLGIIVSAITLLGFFALMIRGLKNRTLRRKSGGAHGFRSYSRYSSQ